MTHEEYLEAKAQLDRLNKKIDDAPANAKPVFPGIAELHTKVRRYEREHPSR